MVRMKEQGLVGHAEHDNTQREREREGKREKRRRRRRRKRGRQSRKLCIIAKRLLHPNVPSLASVTLIRRVTIHLYSHNETISIHIPMPDRILFGVYTTVHTRINADSHTRTHVRADQAYSPNDNLNVKHDSACFLSVCLIFARWSKCAFAF